MQQKAQSISASKKLLWTGRIFSGLSIAFMFMDGVMKLFMPAPVVQGMTRLGYPIDLGPGIGIVVLGCAAVYAIPQTSVLGAILLTGFLGGAVASNVRVGNALFSNTLFPIYVALFVWGGLYLRDGRLRALVPFVSQEAATEAE